MAGSHCKVAHHPSRALSRFLPLVGLTVRHGNVRTSATGNETDSLDQSGPPDVDPPRCNLFVTIKYAM